MSIAAPATNPASDLELKLPATIGTNGQYLTVDGSGNLTWANPPGITMTDQWRITSNYTFAASGTTYDITANWERNDSTGFGSIGTGMTESSGIFTFPQTGIYWVRLFTTTYTATGDTTSITAYISAQKNGGSFASKASGSEAGYTTNAYGTLSLDFIFDVEDVSGDKVKMQAQSTGADRRILASSTAQRTGFTFIRLGDT